VFRILVVDDNPDSADSLARLLSLEGYETQVAYGGAEALLTAASLRPHLAVLDIRMGDVDGIHVASQLRSEHSDVRLIAATGVSLLDWHERLENAGFEVVLAKPVDPAELLRAMEKLLVPPEPLSD
jgi:CheY-like chemotaxis protein